MPAPHRGSAIAGWWLTVVVAAAFLMPRFVTPGGYTDGLLYASIARNLALGIGDWWTPAYTQTLFPVFHEHPPLMFVLTSGFFHLLGDRFWTEKAFSVVVLAVGAVALRGIWLRSGAAASLAFLPVLLWLLIPQTPWLVTNHMLELPVAVSALLAVWALQRARACASLPRELPWHLLAAGAIVAGFLVKGPFALFPLAAPLALAAPDGWRALRGGLLRCVVVTAAAGLVLALLLLHDGVRGNLATYLDRQVVASLTGDRGAHPGGRWNLVRELFDQLWPVALPALAAGGMVARRLPTASEWRAALPWLLIGLSASLPLLASPRHAGHYLGASLPFFALALAIPVAALLAPLMARPWASHPRLPRYAAVAGLLALAVVAAVGATLWGQPRRERGWHGDALTVRAHVPPGTVIAGDPSLAADFRLHAYLQRYARVSLDRRPGPPRAWWLGPPSAAPAGSRLVAPCGPSGRSLFALEGGR